MPAATRSPQESAESRGRQQGNVSDDGTYTYAFNYKNLIVKAKRESDSAVVGECRYDALGRRVEKVVTGATYRYIYSGHETVSVYTTTGTCKQDDVYTHSAWRERLRPAARSYESGMEAARSSSRGRSLG